MPLAKELPCPAVFDDVCDHPETCDCRNCSRMHHETTASGSTNMSERRQSVFNTKEHIPAQVPYEPDEHPFAPHEKPLTGFQRQLLEEMRRMSGIMEKVAKRLSGDLEEDKPASTSCPAGLAECEHPAYIGRCDLCPANTGDKEEKVFECPVTLNPCEHPEIYCCADCKIAQDDVEKERKEQKDNEVLWHLVDGSAGQVKDPIAGDIVWVASKSVHRPCIGLGLPMIVPGKIIRVDKARGRYQVVVFSPYDQLGKDYKPEFLECTYTYGLSELFPSMEACVKHYTDVIQHYAERNAWELRKHLGKESIDGINDKLWSYLDNQDCVKRGEPETTK